MYNKPKNWYEVSGLIIEIGEDYINIKTEKNDIIKLCFVRTHKDLKNKLGFKILAKGILTFNDNVQVLLTKEIEILKLNN